MLIFLHYLDCISYKQFDTVTTIMSSISPAKNQAIKRLKVKCKNSPGHAAEELGQHEANCDDNAIVPCPNLCLIPSAPAEAGTAGYTTRTMPRKDLPNHLSECPRRNAICGYCGITGVYQWVANRHMQECTKLEVMCPNEGCQERVVHLYLPEHRQMCPYESIPCRYETLGRTYVSPRMQNPATLEEVGHPF